jgi:hypothetical protein
MVFAMAVPAAVQPALLPCSRCISAPMKRSRKGTISARRRASLSSAIVVVGLGLLSAAVPARADPNDYVLTLDFTGGEHEAETKLGAASSGRNGAPAGEAAALGWGRGVSDAWFTEAYVQFANASAGASAGGLDAVSWENVVRLSEPGQWLVDVGALLEIERPRAASQGWKITAGPLLQKDIDQVQINANLLLTRVVDGQPFEPTQLSYQFQVRYRSDPRLEFGMQALGDLGSWNHWGNPNAQAHRLGPAIFGRHKLAPARGINYNAALLLGVSRGAPNATLRAQIEYEY